jgi:hypothetical protein
MPNWCANSLKLVATTAESEKKLTEIVQELERAKTAGKDAELFALIKPIPEALKITAGFLGAGTPEQTALLLAEKQNLATYGYKNWYDFCVAEWGTKWDAKTENDEFEIEGNQVTIFFDTAWSPPMGIYCALEDMGFKVEATYVEQGMGYIGFYKDGVDKCEQMEQFYTESSEDEDEFPVVCEKIDKYFESNGFSHSPTNFGG